MLNVPARAARPGCARHERKLLWLGVIALFVSGCGSSNVVTLHGAGPTFLEPIYKRWFRKYYNIDPRVRISYQGLGSGRGSASSRPGWSTSGPATRP